MSTTNKYYSNYLIKANAPETQWRNENSKPHKKINTPDHEIRSKSEQTFPNRSHTNSKTHLIKGQLSKKPTDEANSYKKEHPMKKGLISIKISTCFRTSIVYS